MDDLLTGSLPVQATLQVDETAGVADHQGGSAGLVEVGQLALEELGGKLGVFDREDAAKAAAVLPFGQVKNLDLLYVGEKQPRRTV